MSILQPSQHELLSPTRSNQGAPLAPLLRPTQRSTSPRPPLVGSFLHAMLHSSAALSSTRSPRLCLLTHALTLSRLTFHTSSLSCTTGLPHTQQHTKTRKMESGSVLKGLFYGGFASCVAETCECPIASIGLQIPSKFLRFSPASATCIRGPPGRGAISMYMYIVSSPSLSLSHVPSSCL